jgi:uncharacterized membrane protein
MTAGIECSELMYAAEYERVARRNNSLSSTGRILVFAYFFTVSFGIAGAFALLGAWLILPFAGLEMLGLYLAFSYIDRHAADFERITIADGRLTVEWFEAGQSNSREFHPGWARLVTGSDGRLALRSHGRETEIGRHMNEDQRLALARELGGKLCAGAVL